MGKLFCLFLARQDTFDREMLFDFQITFENMLNNNNMFKKRKNSARYFLHIWLEKYSKANWDIVYNGDLDFWERSAGALSLSSAQFCSPGARCGPAAAR